jgi:hypothetical protein
MKMARRPAIRGGWAVCEALSNGSSRQHEAIHVAEESASTSSKPGDSDVSFSQAQRFVSIAANDLCPQY